MRILLGHILPNIMPIMVVQMSLTMGSPSSTRRLSFIGLGVRPPTPSGHHGGRWRGLHGLGEWVDAFFPGAALMVAVFCFNLLATDCATSSTPQRRT